jgi:predicted nucleic acid-binding protein
MARVSYLLDTDILIDWLEEQAWAKTLIWDSDSRLYCSSVSRKELLAKRGLSDSRASGNFSVVAVSPCNQCGFNDCCRCL